jgi:atypical dual specificity phosphatase
VLLIAGGRVQAAQPAEAFFTAPANDVAAQFVRTGSCCVASPDAPQEVLGEGVCPPPPLPPAARPQPVTAPVTPPPTLDTELAAVLAVAQDDGLLRQPQQADPSAQPEYRGPRGFRWVLPGRLGTAPLPGAVLSIDLDLMALKTVGVTMLITLTRGDLPQAKLAEHGLRNLHLPIYDREAPSVNQLRMLAIRMTRLLEQGEVLCVHCRAGLGRTGTVVAGWLMHQGMTADAALQRLREIDKEYVQSANQEAFLLELETSFAR